MSWSIVFAPQVKFDLADACDWHDAQGPGHSERFLDAFDRCIEGIRAPDFIRELNLFIAKCVNARLGRWESFWAPGS